MTADVVLPVPAVGADAAVAWVRTHLGDLTAADVAASPAVRGGQRAADRRLAEFQVAGYAARRNEIWPPDRRGASALSPYVRHGLIGLPALWRHVAGGPGRDVTKYRDELLWQEYSRHVYARFGSSMPGATRFTVSQRTAGGPPAADVGWPRDLACLDLTVGELERDGWVPNQARMWLASHWAVRGGLGWRDGEDLFFRHLLDGSRAANRLGWAWTVGAGTGKPYGFARRQVENRAPGLCAGCPHRDDCPIESWPAVSAPEAQHDADPRWRHDPDLAATTGPTSPDVAPTAGSDPLAALPTAVWLTAESLGDDDPALVAHRDLPAVFVFDAPLLARLRLDPRRLVFLAETLADLGTRREVSVLRGDPRTALAGRQLATTYAPVPGWRARARVLRPAVVHPWPWLVPPHAGPVGSFSAWRAAGRW